MEEESIRAWHGVLSDQPPGLVIDAGAQVGLFTGTALSLGHHVVAIDARPEHVQMLETSVRLNRLTHAAGAHVPQRAP